MARPALKTSLARALALSLVLWPARAHAQEPALVPPKAIHAGAVPYPATEAREAVVIVELTVDPSGKVESTRIVDGAEPFASATALAAKTWTFEPAKRGDTTVPARIRMRIAFHAPLPSSAESPPDPRSSEPAAVPPEKPGPIEQVRVVGHRADPGGITMGTSEARQIPGAFGDPFRVIDSFPGVTPAASGIPFFFVRGAPPGDTGYFLDGLRLPLLFHVGVGPSVIQPGLIDHVDFYPSNGPVQYGRYTGGIVAGTITEPTDRPHAEGNLRLFDAGGFVESPLAGGKTTVMVGGRYSYAGLLLPLFAPRTHLDYWDYQGRVTYRANDKDTFSVLALGSHDYLAQDETGENGATDQKVLLKTNFHRIDLRWDRKTSSHARLRAAVTLGVDTSGDHRGTSTDWNVAMRSEYQNKLSRDVTVRLGADAELHAIDVDDTDPNASLPGTNPSSIYVPRREMVGGVRGDVVWRILPKVEITPGLRADIYTSRRTRYPPPPPGGIIVSDYGYLSPDPGHATAIPALDPRIASRVFVSDHVTYISALGLAHQAPGFLAAVPAIDPGGLENGLQTAIQASQGVELALPLAIHARVTAFYSKFYGLTDATASCPGADFSDASAATNPCIKNRLDGKAFGAELLLRRSFDERLSGWISYTLSRSTRQSHSFGSTQLLEDVPSEYDRTHVLSVALAYDLGRRWHAGARFYYYTGRPYTPTYQGFPQPPYDSARMPDFWRFDVRLEKSWRIGETGQLALVLEGLNVTLNKETFGVDCLPPLPSTPYTSKPPGAPYDKCTNDEVGPVSIPSVGLEGSF